MKKTLLLLIACYAIYPAGAQLSETDSLKKELAVTKEESQKIVILEGLSYAYLSASPDTALQYALQGLRLAEQTNDLKGKAICTNALASVYFHTGDYSKALELYLQALEMKEKLHDPKILASTFFNIANVYIEQADYKQALSYLIKTKESDERTKDSAGILFDLYSLSSLYLRMKNTDSALQYSDQAFQLARRTNDEQLIGAIVNTYGEIYAAMNNLPKAIENYHRSNVYVKAISDNEVMASNYIGLAKAFGRMNLVDSALYYARKALSLAQEGSFMKQVLESSSILATLYKSKKQYDLALHYQTLSMMTKDSLFNVEQVKKVQNLKLTEQQRQQALEADKTKYRNRIKFFVVIFASAVLLMIAVLLWRNNKQKQKAYGLLQVEKSKTERALEDLKATQLQLIQREKMASLGELMAGIAHEIQNPLNFVTNFTEVNLELLEDLKKEAPAQNTAGIIELTETIKSNEEKISHHGKRADAIVKSMLQHSQLTGGSRQLTDINALVQEYVRITYYGILSGGKTVDVKLNTVLDESAGNIPIIQQDIGRVLLNLLNNAFYAVTQKKNKLKDNYQPEITVSTKRLDEKVAIRLRDNGSGIPHQLVDKIFQPFFTTRPPGEGTGLGLSLSYEIITKAHGGDLKVDTREGEFTEFTIILPG